MGKKGSSVAARQKGEEGDSQRKKWILRGGGLVCLPKRFACRGGKRKACRPSVAREGTLWWPAPGGRLLKEKESGVSVWGNREEEGCAASTAHKRWERGDGLSSSEGRKKGPSA